MDYGKQACPDTVAFDESAIQNAIVRALDRFSKDDFQRFQDTIRDSIVDAIGMMEDGPEAITVKHRIALLNQEIMTLVDISLSEDTPLEDYDEKFKALSDEIEILTDRLKAIENAGRTAEELEAKQQKLRGAIEQMKSCCVEYDEQAVRQMIECIRAYPDGKLEIIFGGGYTVTEQME